MKKLTLLHLALAIGWLLPTPSLAIVTGRSNDDGIVSRVPPAFVATAGSPGVATLERGDGSVRESSGMELVEGDRAPEDSSDDDEEGDWEEEEEEWLRDPEDNEEDGEED